VLRGKPLPATKSYWDIPFNPVTVTDEKEIAEELLQRIKEAIDIRLIADVPLGAFLSGGVDSSAVVAMMSGLSSEPVKTCSISFGDPRFNESEFAAQVAKRYQTSHTVQQVEANDFSLLNVLGGLYDEPFADSSALPTFRVCELARRQVTVALSGDGGDENLAGYQRYRWQNREDARRALLPLALRRNIFGLLGNIYPKALWAPRILRARSTLASLACDSVEGYFRIISIFDNSTRRELFSDSLLSDLQGYDSINVLREHARHAPTDHPLSLVQYLDMKTYIPGDILTKVDRASMAHSLEVRVPLLDHKLIEWISGLSPDLKLRGNEGKYIFKKALQPYLPHEILYRPKMGFAVPLANWFRGTLKDKARESLLGPTIAESGLFNLDFLQKLLVQHQSGRQDHSVPIWALMMFESFLSRL
jgi:asparagine synthase (glutamine-hydrolysing)